MTEPNTLSATPEGPDPPEGGTVGWVQDPSAEPAADPTQSLPPHSTPGPQHPERRTDSEATEQMDDSGGGTGTLPRIAGLRIEKLIGRGGMGRVYRAVHLELNKVVALKLITTAGRDEHAVRGRFEREVQALARIEHANIVPIYHAGDWHGFPYFTMKLVPGGPLSEHLHRFTGNPEACAKLMAKVARAVQALHDAGVVHRDLKPLNILLGEADEPLVADFGLAKWLDDPASDLTMSHAPLGTRQYMAPEQTLGLRGCYSQACDIWALGVTLYELLAGTRPFPDDGSSDLAERIRTADPPPLAESVPVGLAAIVGRCLAKQPVDRYPTAAAVAADLEDWLRGTLVPPPAPPRPSRRAPRWAVALGIVVLLLLIAVPASVIPWKQPPPPKKSIAERLRDRESVTLVGEKGLPAEQSMLPVFEGTLTLGQQGFATLASPVFAAVELSREEFPWPVVLRAEYALLTTHNPDSRGGVCVGGKLTPAADPCYTLLALMNRESVAAGEKKGENLLTETAEFELWQADQLDELRASCGPPVRRTVRAPMRPDPTLRWHVVEVVMQPHLVRGSWNGLPLDPVFGTKGNQIPERSVEFFLQQFAVQRPKPPGRAPAFTPPYIGPGVGVCVFNATAVYRNVTLTRADP